MVHGLCCTNCSWNSMAARLIWMRTCSSRLQKCALVIFVQVSFLFIVRSFVLQGNYTEWFLLYSLSFSPLNFCPLLFWTSLIFVNLSSIRFLKFWSNLPRESIISYSTRNMKFSMLLFNPINIGIFRAFFSLIHANETTT